MDSVDEIKASPQVVALPLTPFKASRMSLYGEEGLPLMVVGLRHEPKEDEWKFICIGEAGEEIYVTEQKIINGKLPSLIY